MLTCMALYVKSQKKLHVMQAWFSHIFIIMLCTYIHSYGGLYSICNQLNYAYAYVRIYVHIMCMYLFTCAFLHSNYSLMYILHIYLK